MADELRSGYHRQLEEIDGALSRMILLVEEAISAASAALLAADDEAAAVVALRREQIKELHGALESLCSPSSSARRRSQELSLIHI